MKTILNLGIVALLALGTTHAVAQDVKSDDQIIRVVPTFFDVPSDLDLNLAKPLAGEDVSTTVMSGKEFEVFLESMTPENGVDELVYHDLFIRPGKEATTGNRVSGQTRPTPLGMKPIFAGWTISAEEDHGTIALEVRTLTTRVVHEQTHAPTLLKDSGEGDVTVLRLQMEATGKVRTGETLVVFGVEPKVPSRHVLVALTATVLRAEANQGVNVIVPTGVAKQRMGRDKWRGWTFANAATLLEEAIREEADGDFLLAWAKFRAAKQNYQAYGLDAPDRRPEVVKDRIAESQDGEARMLARINGSPGEEVANQPKTDRKVKLEADKQTFDRGVLIGIGKAKLTTRTNDGKPIEIRARQIEYDKASDRAKVLGAYIIAVDDKIRAVG